jgi:hypothetical protein
MKRPFLTPNFRSEVTDYRIGPGLSHATLPFGKLRLSYSVKFIYAAAQGAHVGFGGGAIVTGGAEAVAQLIVR